MSSDNVATKVLEQLTALSATVDKLNTDVTEIKTKANTPNNQGPYGIVGAIPKDSEGYSIHRASAFSQGWLKPEQCKVEMDTHVKLKSMYERQGFKPYHNTATFLVPFSSAHLPNENDADDRLIAETKMRLKAYETKYDPDEAAWLQKKFRFVSKALGTVSDSAGGELVGFPTMGELIDIQRNKEVFANAGASEVGLPANGRIQYPKLVGGATAYWVGEATATTVSQQTTGHLLLEAKKLGIAVPMNNELLRFTSPTTEALVRNDMAQVAARKADLAMLEGTGGTQIKGLITYTSQSAWNYGVDKIIKLTASTTATDGNTFAGADVQRMIDALADEEDPTAWIMRKTLFTAIKNRRADAVTAADGAGQFLHNQFRDLDDSFKPQLGGLPVVRSSQVSGARTKGSGTTLTYAICGNFKEWLIGRFGVMEFLTSQHGDYFLNDQTALRGIQHLDAGARHAASFAWMDELLQS